MPWDLGDAKGHTPDAADAIEHKLPPAAGTSSDTCSAASSGLPLWPPASPKVSRRSRSLPTRKRARHPGPASRLDSSREQPPGRPGVSRATLSDQVAAAIGGAILSRQLPAGAPIVQTEWAERLGVRAECPSAARSRLCAEGILTLDRRSGSKQPSLPSISRTFRTATH